MNAISVAKVGNDASKGKRVYFGSVFCSMSIDTRNKNCGVLFLIYINDLSRICKYTTRILFADNTNTFLNGGDLKQMETAINEELLNISKWLKAYKLSLNVKKTTTWYLLERNILGIY